MVLAFGGTSHSFSLPSSSARASLFSCSLAQRGSNFGVPAPIITTPDNMSHLLAHQGVMPRNQQEHADNNMIGPKLSPLTPLPAGTGEMFSACQTPRFGGASMSMAAAIYSAAPMSAGCHTITAAADFGDIEMACSPRTGPSLSGFSVADIYMPPVSPFGPCTSALASTTGAPTPLFMNANSFGINPLPLAAASPWPTGTAMDVSTSMSEQLRAAPPALPPGPY
ncbi:hypothetical protein IWW47_006231 [Coemansia sp. RSA 2052]|nr:hypothetical protein IWW47_006231 [Coemansia sp. RSA 2052]